MNKASFIGGPSVRPSVAFSFRTVTQKLIAVFSGNFAGTCTKAWGVCCIVFDIDGMLFEFFKNFLNIEKNKIVRIFSFKISCFLRVLCYFQHLTFFFKKNSSLLFNLAFYAIFNIIFVLKYWKVPLHLLVKWEVVSPNSRYRDSGNLYPIWSSTPLFWFLISNMSNVGVVWGGGGVTFFLHLRLFPTFPEKK